MLNELRNAKVGEERSSVKKVIIMVRNVVEKMWTYDVEKENEDPFPARSSRKFHAIILG